MHYVVMAGLSGGYLPNIAYCMSGDDNDMRAAFWYEFDRATDFLPDDEYAAARDSVEDYPGRLIRADIGQYEYLEVFASAASDCELDEHEHESHESATSGADMRGTE